MELAVVGHQLTKPTIMFNLKSTIYQTEWLDLVFENRNKSYGAYELRLNYNKRLGYALFIASFLVVLLFLVPLVYQRFSGTDASAVVLPNANDSDKVFDVVFSPKKEEKKEDLPAAGSPKSDPVKLKSTRFVDIVVVNTPVQDEPPTIKDLQNSTISSQTVAGTETKDNVVSIHQENGSGAGLGDEAGNGNELVTPDLLEKYPEFPGGMDAFANYLRKNLRYPERAVDAGINGKVIVSFVIEKDGRLTDIRVLRGIGYGCDEEATRVLRKSPPWKPGIQNSRNVRVLYTIPLVFRMGE